MCVLFSQLTSEMCFCTLNISFGIDGQTIVQTSSMFYRKLEANLFSVVPVKKIDELHFHDIILISFLGFGVASKILMDLILIIL